MNSTKKNHEEEVLLESVSKTQLFFNKYKNVMLYIAIAILVIGAGSAAYYFFGYAPAKQEAEEAVAQQVGYFSQGNFEVALNGDGQNLGLADIIDEYGSKAGKAVYAYAGLCELNLKNYESAISYFDSYKGKEPLMKSCVLAAKGDAYCGLENYEAAVKCYREAVAASESQLNARYLLNAGLAAEKLGDMETALSFYNTIKTEYPMSAEGGMIEKYIVKVETMLAK